MGNAQVDLMGPNGSTGFAGQVSGMSVHQMRPYVGADGKAYITTYNGGDPKSPKSYGSVPIQTNATLRRDEWNRLDTAVQQIAEARLNGIQDLITNGLTYDIGNGMGSTVLEYHDISDALEAEMTMDGVSRAKGDRPNYTAKYLPLPIVHADYELNARVLSASRSLGQPLDTTLAERASRKVNERLEKMLFTNTNYGAYGGTIYSYVNFPSRNKINLAKAWNAAGTTAAEIIADVMSMKQAAIDAHFYGPYVLYVPTSYEVRLDNDYDTTRGNTIRQRIMAIEGIKAVKVADTLATGNVLFVQMTSDVVRLVRGMGLQNIEWQTEGGMVHKYKVMTIQVPQIRADQEEHCGIVHMAAGLV